MIILQAYRTVAERASSRLADRLGAWEPAIAKLLVLCAVVVYLLLAAYIDRPVVDDALISMAYGKTLFTGGGLRVTRYSEIAEGFSNPVWTVLVGGVEGLHLNAIAVAKTLGMLLGSASLPVMMLWAPLAQRRQPRIEDALGPLIAATNPSLVYWSQGGLENGLLTFLLAGFGALVWARPNRARGALVLGATGALATLTRPEAAMYCGAIVGIAVIDRFVESRGRPRACRADVVAAAALVGPVALYVIFRRVYFGTWLPNTYYAKSAWFAGNTREQVHAMGLSYSEHFYVTVTALLYAGLGGGLASLLGGWRVAKVSLAATGVAGAMAYFVWFTGQDWMKEHRMLCSMVPFVALSVGTGVSGARRLLGRERVRILRWPRVIAYLGLAALASWAAWSASRQHAERWKAVKDGGGDTPRVAKDRAGYGADIRGALQPFSMTHPYLGAPDMGYLGLGLRDFEILDLAGLTNATVARHYGNVAAMRDYFTNEGYPTMLLVWGPSNNLYDLGDVLARYRGAKYAGSHKVYARMTADSDDRCPDGKAEALAARAVEMETKVRGDLQADEPVRALARWRCYFTYRSDRDLPSASSRRALAFEARDLAKSAETSGEREKALRRYSLCAVVGASSFWPSSACRMSAERLRGELFPRPPVRR